MSKTNNKSSLVKLIGITVVIIAMGIVGILGFNLFSKKADNSKALSDLKQVQEIMLTNLVSTDGGKDLTITCDGVTFRYEMTKGRTVFEGSLNTDDNGVTFTREIRNSFDELKKFDGSFDLDGDTIVYTTANGKGKAIWVSGKLPSSYK